MLTATDFSCESTTKKTVVYYDGEIRFKRFFIWLSSAGVNGWHLGNSQRDAFA